MKNENVLPVVDFNYKLINTVHFNPNYFIPTNSFQTPTYFMMVENTPEGLEFLKSFRQENRSKFNITVRGRAKNRKAVMKSLGRKYNPYRADGNDLGIKGSERVAVYIRKKY